MGSLETYGCEKYTLVEPVPDYFVRPYPMTESAERKARRAKRIALCTETSPDRVVEYFLEENPHDSNLQTLVSVYHKANGHCLHQLPMIDGLPELQFGLPAAWDHDVVIGFIQGGEQTARRVQLAKWRNEHQSVVPRRLS